jgi:hypothetical protein
MLLDTPVCDFGWTAPDVTLSDPSGAPFTMSENLGDKGLSRAMRMVAATGHGPAQQIPAMGCSIKWR